ncbi:MAG: hypothetical protein IPL88_00780 [Rhizobiales bacterium]|nr:hypothetical protein [Hyphomicrobiales bacterium]
MATVTSPIAIDSVVGGENTRPDVAVLSTGRIITVFTTTADQVSSLDPFAQSDPPANTADSDIDGVFLSARGVVGTQFEISIDIEPGHISPRYTQNSAQVALTADGGFAVLYNDLSESFSNGTTSFTTRVNQVVRRFDGTTGALQPEQTVMIPHIQLNGPYSVGAGAPSLIGLSDNSVLVGFHAFTPPDALMLDADASSFGLYERSLSASNTKGAFARVNGATAGDQRNLTFALSSGGALVNLFVSSASGTPALMMNVNGAESVVDSQFIMGQDTRPRAAFLDADSFVVVYERQFSAYVPGVSDSNNVAFTIMNVNGTVETARVEVTPPDGLGVAVDNPQIAVGRDGTFLVAWDERGTGASAGTIRGRIYTAAGAPVGAAFDISPIAQAGVTGGAASTPGFSLDAMPDGRFFVSWGTFDGHVKGAFVDGRTQGIVFTGTDLGDEAVGTEFVDDMSGGLADDALYGGLGDDTLHGGAGKDRLEGEDGGDLIYGEAGDDVLIGAAGDDALDGGADSDTADYSGAAAAITIDLAIAGQQNTGQGLDTLISIENLIGASLVDTLRGDGAANRLDGGLGRDVMAGRGGDDVYVVNVANELIAEALNEGTDTVESSVTYRLLANFENLVLAGPPRHQRHGQRTRQRHQGKRRGEHARRRRRDRHDSRRRRRRHAGRRRRGGFPLWRGRQ